MNWRWLRLTLTCLALIYVQSALIAEEPVRLRDLPFDLVVPATTSEPPAPGKRVRQRLDGFEGEVEHLLYLPSNWKPEGNFPVIVEFPGNGPYVDELGNRSTGQVDDCKLGYGISGGQDFIWLSLPFVDLERKCHALYWWGDPAATARYCRQAVALVCEKYGGDPKRVVLTGFSRGAIACNYIGLRDDETARLWRAMICHSHYDGVRRWGYPEQDEAAADTRLARLSGRPQYITQEKSTDDIRVWLKTREVDATIVTLPFPDHTADWILKDVAARKDLRTWLKRVLEK